MLRFTEMKIPAADLGTPSVLPDIRASYPDYAPPRVVLDNGLTADEGAWVNQGRIHTMLPYTMQDGYNRRLTERALKTAVLENEHLRAEFATELGGRMWSLYSIDGGYDLYMRNGVFQPANLALRNAWFSGGIEWNIGIIGHHPFTCSPLFIARYRNAAGGEVLKMYEYERKRGITYCVRAALAGDTMLVRVNIENLSGRDTYVYWWSNGAVLETPDSRVIVPAESYYSYPTENGATVVKAPAVPKDAYYPANHDHAYDYFYRIPADRRRFMSYFDGNGRGMAQFSTDNELGRKLFVWGTEKEGGRNWNRWLQRDDRLYAELQSGLLHSQSEQRPMLAGETIEWTEGYIAASGDPAIIHGEDYARANRYVEDMLEDGGRFELVENSDRYFEPADGCEEEIVSYGSGWGALEEMARKKAGIADYRLSRIVRFPEESIVGRPEEEFCTLLRSGRLGEHDIRLTDGADGSSVIEFAMGGRFIHAFETMETKDWYAWLQLGCAYYEAKSFDAARMAFRKSISCAENPIALRSLAWICAADYRRNGDRALIDEGMRLMKRAVELCGTYPRLICDAISYMQSFGRPEDIVELIRLGGHNGKEKSDNPAYGRVSLFFAQNLARTGELDEAVSILRSAPEVADIREGEVSTSAVWLEVFRAVIARDECRAAGEITDSEVFEKYPLPGEMDFRMS